MRCFSQREHRWCSVSTKSVSHRSQCIERGLTCIVLKPSAQTGNAKLANIDGLRIRTSCIGNRVPGTQIARRSGKCPDMVKTVGKELGSTSIETPVCRFEPEESAKRCRNSDRAVGVGSECERNQPASHSSSRTAR